MADDTRIGVSIEAQSSAAGAIGQTTSALAGLSAKAAGSAVDLSKLSAAAQAQIAAQLGLASAASTATAAIAAETAAVASSAGVASTAAAAHEGLRLATAGTTREFIVLGHEAISGNFSRIPGSILVLAERMGSLHKVVEALSGPWGVVAGVAVAALAAIGYAAYQSIESVLALRDATDRFAMGGGGFTAAQAQASEFTQSLQRDFHEGAGTIKEMADELRHLPVDILPAATALGRLSEELAGSGQYKNAAEAMKAIVGEAGRGGESFLKAMSAQVNLRGAVTATGESLDAYVKAQDAAGNSSAAVIAVIAAAGAAYLDLGGKAQTARNALRELGAAEAAMPGYAAGAAMAGTADVGPLRPSEYPRQAAPESPAIVAGRETAEKATPEIGKRITLQAQLNQLLAAEAELRARIAAGPQRQDDEGIAQAQIDLNRNLQAQAELRAQASRTATQGEREAQQSTIEGLQEQARAQQANAERVVAIKQQEYEATLAYQAKLQQEAQPGLSNDQAKAIAAQLPEVQRLADEVTDAKRRAANEALEVTLEAERAEVAASQQGSAARVAEAQRELQQITAARNAGQKSNLDVEKAAEHLADVQRAATERAFEAFKTGELAKVKAAQGAADQIKAIYDGIAERAIQDFGADSPQAAAAKAGEQEALQAASRQRFEGAEQAYSGGGRIDELQLGIQRAQAAQQEAQLTGNAKQEAIVKEIQAEEQLTQAVYAQRRAQLQTILDSDATTVAEKQKVNEQIIELDLKSVEQQEQNQAKLTEAIQAENEKRTQVFTQAFDKIGSAFQQFIDAGLTKSETLAQAGQKLARSLIESVANGLMKEGSDLVGGQLAKLFGVKAGDLGTVLGEGVGKMLGLYQTPPKTDAAQTNEKLDDANKHLAAIEEAVKGGGTAKPATTTPATGTAQQTYVPAPAGYSSGLPQAGSYPGTIPPDQAAALVRQYESGGNYNAGWGGKDLSNAPLGPYGFPQWSGAPGPQGNSRAAGAYQFEPGTWNPAAQQLGISDFSPQSQDRVFNQVYGQQGFAPWAPYNPKLAGAIRSQEQQGGVQAQAIPGGAVPAGSAGAGTGNISQGSALQTAIQQQTSATQTAITTQAQGNQQQQQTQSALDTATTAAQGQTTQTQQATSQAQQATQAQGQNVQALNQNTAQLQQQKSGGATGGGAATTGSGGSSVGGDVSLLSQGLQTTTGTLKLFGGQLSTTGTILSGAGNAISQLQSFGQKLTSTFTTANSTTQTLTTGMTTAQTATQGLQTANTLNTTATASNTLATEANSVASSSGSGAGILGGGILSLSGGGIIPSAAGGMVIGGGGIGGGAQLILGHANEMVLPSNLSTGIQSIISSTGAVSGIGGASSAGSGSQGQAAAQVSPATAGLGGAQLSPASVATGTGVQSSSLLQQAQASPIANAEKFMDQFGPIGVLLASAFGLIGAIAGVPGALAATIANTIGGPAALGGAGAAPGIGGQSPAAVSSGATSIAEVAGAAGGQPQGIGSAGIAGAPVVSAQGGMVVPGSGGGQLILGHPGEMVLPRNLSEGVQSAVQGGGRNQPPSNTANMNYSPTINGGLMSKSYMDGLLRSHGDTMLGFARNAVRNGFRG